MCVMHHQKHWAQKWHSDRKALNYDGKNGYLNVCKYIVENIEDKSPSDANCKTPLHTAALNGHLNVNLS